MLQNRQTNTMLPPACRRVRFGWRRWWWAFKKTEFCTGTGVPRESCAHPETELAGQTCSLAVFACIICYTVFLIWVHVLTRQSVAYYLPLSFSGGDQLVSQQEIIGSRREGKGCSRFALHCSRAPRQHEVSGSPTPSATWDTGGHSHTQSGMWCGWNVCSMECYGGGRQDDGGMWCNKCATLCHKGDYGNVFFYVGVCSYCLLCPLWCFYSLRE